jgi:hypothetical protein
MRSHGSDGRLVPADPGVRVGARGTAHRLRPEHRAVHHHHLVGVGCRLDMGGRTALRVGMAAAISLLAAACAAGPGGSPSPTVHPPASGASAAARGPAAPTATGRQPACPMADLNMVVGAPGAAGGEEGMTILLANQSPQGCWLGGPLGLRLEDMGGSPLPTAAPPQPPGDAWLVPDRVALDPWWPQPGEATIRVTWENGVGGSGGCPGSPPRAGEVALLRPGGDRISGRVLTATPMAPCRGSVALGPVTPAGAPAAFPSPLAAAEQAGRDESDPGVTADFGAATTTMGTRAAYVDYALNQEINGQRVTCDAVTYLWQDAAGWHVLDTTCVQAAGLAPLLGRPSSILGPGQGCATVRAAPGHLAPVATCLAYAPGSTVAAQYPVDQGPVFVAETDATSGVAEGTLWWHLQGEGWVSQDFLVYVS